MTTILITILITWVILGIINTLLRSNAESVVGYIILSGPVVFIWDFAQEYLIELIKWLTAKKLKKTLPALIPDSGVHYRPFVLMMKTERLPNRPWFKHNSSRWETCIEMAIDQLVKEGKMELRIVREKERNNWPHQAIFPVKEIDK